MRDDETRNPRWARSQRFTLSAYGRTVTAAYRSGIAAMGNHSERGGFEKACASWAEMFELRPEDGMYLMEVATKSVTLSELGEALAVCSQSRADVERCVQRLCAAGLVTPVPRA